MKIGLLSDTHSYIDVNILNHLKVCDEVWHAGDIGDLSVMKELEKNNKVFAVFGNIDNQNIRALYPENQILKREGLKFWMTHIGGYPGKFSARIQKQLKEIQPDVFICGHSHILKVMRSKEFNLLHLNPGACGKQGLHKIRTLIRFDVGNKKISGLEVIELGKRGAIH